MFFRLTTDGLKEEFDLRSFYSGPTGSACWVVGGAPSLTAEVVAQINDSPIPVFSMNLAGSGLLRPNFWTSYDPTARFHRSVYLDASIIKFVHRSRAMDLVPETTFKVCEAPSTLFFERTRDVGFTQFPTKSPSSSAGITDWQDSFIQLIDLAYQLGFRTLFLTGCDLMIAPDARLQELGRRCGVEYASKELLGDFVQRCRQGGLQQQELEGEKILGQYHFDESKSLKAAIQTDFHYYRVVQYLRLSRRSLAMSGLQLISATPDSRLNDHFPFRSVEELTKEILLQTGDPADEQTAGRYTQSLNRTPPGIGPMRDFRPHFWKSERVEEPVPHRSGNSRGLQIDRLKKAAMAIPEYIVDLNEQV